MKKILCVTLFLFVERSVAVHSQAMVVTDPIAHGFHIESIIKTIENGYTMYQQLQAMLKTFENSVKQIEQQVKNFRNLSMEELSLADPLGSYRAVMTYADRMMTYEENIEDVISSKTMQWGNKSFSYADLFTRPPINVYDAEGNLIEEGYLEDAWEDPFEMFQTPEERARFNRTYGMSYGHYMRYNAMGQMISQGAGKMLSYFEKITEDMHEDRERLDKIVKTENESDSIIAQAQRQAAINATQAQDIKTIANSLSMIGQVYAQQAYQQELERTAKANVMTMNDLPPPEYLLEIYRADSEKGYK
jgi:hypothetical protein